MFKNFLFFILISLSSCAFHNNVCDDKNVREQQQTQLNKISSADIKDKESNSRRTNIIRLGGWLSAAIKSKESNADKFTIVKFLIKEGADIKSFVKSNINDEGEPIYYPLYLAIIENNDKLAELFIKNGADINKCHEKILCIEIVSDFPNAKIMKLLIDNGVDVNSMNKDNETPLDIFYIHKVRYNRNLDEEDIKVLQMLINAGAKLNRHKDNSNAKAFLEQYLGTR